MSTFTRTAVENPGSDPEKKPVSAPKNTGSTTIVEHRTSKGRRKTLQRVLLSLVGLAIIIGAYFYFRPSTTTTYTIRYSAVEQGDITKAVTATGTLQATKTVQVGSQVSGTILKLYADFNSVVHKGQLLAQLDPTFNQTAVTSAQANVAQAQANLSNAERDESRAATLLKQQLIAQADYDATKTKLLDARATLAQVSADLEKAKVNLSYTTISSPINGTVVSRNVDVGQTVAASLNAPVLFTIAEDLSKMQVSANVDEADISQVGTGQDVKFTVDAYPGQDFHGVVEQIRINPVTQQNVVTYSVIIDVDNSGGKLLPGMTATVNILSASKQGVMKVPTSALRFTPPDDLLPGAGGQTGSSRSGSAAGGNGAGRSRDTTKKRTQSDRGIIYVKSKDPKVPITAIHVTTGLSDGASTEITSSNPAITVGDSVVIGAYNPNASGGSSSGGSQNRQPGASPLGGAGGGGGGRRF